MSTRLYGVSHLTRPRREILSAMLNQPDRWWSEVELAEHCNTDANKTVRSFMTALHENGWTELEAVIEKKTLVPSLRHRLNQAGREFADQDLAQTREDRARRQAAAASLDADQPDLSHVMRIIHDLDQMGSGLEEMRTEMALMRSEMMAMRISLREIRDSAHRNQDPVGAQDGTEEGADIDSL